MNKRERLKKEQLRIGPRIVRAWFDTVINPMLNALRAENTLLQKKDWTWQFYQTGLEMIKPVSQYIDADAVDNLEQMLYFYPSLKGKIENHDEARDRLFQACRDLHTTIVSRSDLEDIYRTVISQESLAKLGKRMEEMFGSREPSDHINLLAEYIVNNTGEFPYYYTVSPLWNRYRERFLKVLGHPAVVPYTKKTTKAGEQLMRATEALVKGLKDVREELSLKHDVPYVGGIELSLKDTV